MAQFYARATVTTQFVEIRFEVALSLLFPNSNHICLTQASFLQQNQMLQNVFLISVMLRWH